MFEPAQKPVTSGAARRLLPVVAGVLLVVSGCAGTMGGPASGAARDATERARERLLAGLIAGDTATLRDLIAADATARLLTDTATERRELRPLALDAAAALADIDVRVYPDGVTHCTGAVHEYGRYTVQRHAPADSAFSDLGRYGLLWDMSAADRPVLRSADFHLVESGGRHRVPPCTPVADSIFEARRVWVSVHPSATTGDWHPAFVSALRESGWNEYVVSSFREVLESSARLLPSLVVQVGVGAPFVVSAAAGGLDGAVIVVNPQARARRLSYSGMQASAHAGVELRLPVLRTGRLTLAAGPAYVRVNGLWGQSRAAPVTPEQLPDESWTAWAVGASGDIGVVVPFGSRFGFTARLQQRYYPDAAIPGHGGSDAFRVPFGNRSLLIGMGAKLW